MSSKSTVLVVEDEQLMLDIVALELEDAGFAVLQAETGEDAISLLQTSERIDLLLTDIRLPGQISGWTVAGACPQSLTAPTGDLRDGLQQRTAPAGEWQHSSDEALPSFRYCQGRSATWC